MTDKIVADKDDDIRLDRWFKRYFPELNHGAVEKALRKGDIRVEGKKAKAADHVRTGQTITIRDWLLNNAMPAAGARKPTAKIIITPKDEQMMKEAVILKKKDLLVLNKPSGLSVQGGTGITKSVDGLLDTLRFDSDERPKLVHRLDKDTSGVLLLARTTKAAAQLAKTFADKSAEKIYWALVKGVPDSEEGKIDMPLSKQEEGDHEKMAVDAEEGKRAVTYFRIIERLANSYSWVELRPITGRTHQLRVHMAEIGNPIIGDGKYGGKEAHIEGMGISGKLHLHARRLIIPGVVDVTAPLPPHMQGSWKSLGLDLSLEA